MAFSATKCDTVCDRLSLEDYKSCQIWLPPNKEQGWHAIMAYDIIKNNDVVGGTFSSSYHTDSNYTKHEEIIKKALNSFSSWRLQDSIE